MEEIQQPHHQHEQGPEHGRQQICVEASAKYYQFYTVATMLEHVIDCLHTIVSDETNPYHPPISWLSRRQIRPPDDELFLDVMDECTNQKQKLDANFSPSVRARLEKASRSHRKEIVSRMRDGCSPLFNACRYGKLSKARYLLEVCDAQIEQFGLYETIEDHHVHSVSPMWIASVSGHLEVVKLLLEYGSNVNSLSDTGSTPLRSVCFLCKDDDGSFADRQDPDQLESELDSFNRPSDQETDKYFQIVQLLIESGADPSIPNINGGTCLINSIGNFTLTSYLLDQKCDVNASDHQSKTALHYAIQQNRLSVVELLLARGADPALKANRCDDALQLSCLVGNEDIFKLLIRNVNYSPIRLVDAYKLLGSTILEVHYDLSKARQYWQLALDLKSQIPVEDRKDKSNSTASLLSDRLDYNRRRREAYGEFHELESYAELNQLTADDYRIQSLLMSERILGTGHRETLQRLLHRGSFYINCLRPDRCIKLWIYALELRLEHESIFHFESIFSAQAIAKLFSDLLSQNQMVDYADVYDLLSLLINQLESCRNHLEQKPASNLHEDIFDILLAIIVNLLLAINIVDLRRLACPDEHTGRTRDLVSTLVQLNPKSTDGSSLLHVCVNLDVFYGDLHKLLSSRRDQLEAGLVEGQENIRTSSQDSKTDEIRSPVLCLIDTLIESGLELDSTNQDGLSPLQVLCLSSSRMRDKQTIIKLLVERGAHLDRKPMTSEQGELIRQSLLEAGVNPNKHLKLSCLAARKLAEQQRAFRRHSRRSAKCQKQLAQTSVTEPSSLTKTGDDNNSANEEHQVYLTRQLRQLIAMH